MGRRVRLLVMCRHVASAAMRTVPPVPSCSCSCGGRTPRPRRRCSCRRRSPAAHAGDADGGLVPIVRDALLTDSCELHAQSRRIADGVRRGAYHRMRHDRLGIDPRAREQRLADRGAVGGLAPTDARRDRQRETAADLLEVQHVGAVEHREVDDESGALCSAVRASPAGPPGAHDRGAARGSRARASSCRVRRRARVGGSSRSEPVAAAACGASTTGKPGAPRELRQGQPGSASRNASSRTATRSMTAMGELASVVVMTF